MFYKAAAAPEARARAEPLDEGSGVRGVGGVDSTEVGHMRSIEARGRQHADSDLIAALQTWHGPPGSQRAGGQPEARQNSTPACEERCYRLVFFFSLPVNSPRSADVYLSGAGAASFLSHAD